MPSFNVHYGFVLFDGFSNMVLASAIEPLRAARYYSTGGTFNWRLLSLNGEPVVSSSGLVIQPEGPLADDRDYDALFVIAGYGVRDMATAEVSTALRKVSRHCGRIGGLDMGAWLLASAGLLDGRTATIHWQELTAFEEAFLKVTVFTNRFVIDSAYCTAGGATTVMDLMLYLIREKGGDTLAFDVSNMFIYNIELYADDAYGARNRALSARAPQLLQAIRAMRRTVNNPVSLPDIAAEAACSVRTVERLFMRELGVSAGRYYQMIRLRHARRLAEESNLNAAEIAAHTGYASATTLSRAFSSHFGYTIRSLWKRRGGK